MGRLDWLRDIRCVLFDWGGTLCRNEREPDAIGRGVAAIAAEFAPTDAAREALGASLAGALREAYNRAEQDPQLREMDPVGVLRTWGDEMGLSRRPQWDLPRLVGLLWQHWRGCPSPLGAPAPVLAELRRRGYRLGLASNVAAPPDLCHTELKRLGLTEFFEGCTFSSQVGLRKPHPALFQAALRAMDAGGPPEPRSVVYVGDSPRWDVCGAQAAGLRAILFRSDVTSWPQEDYEACDPDAVIDRLDDLLLLLPGPAR